MKIRLNKDKAEEILSKIKSQIDSFDLSNCSMSAEAKEKVVLVYEPTKNLDEKIKGWVLERADTLLLAFLFLLVYIAVSCVRCQCKSAESPQTNNAYTETTICHKVFELPNGRALTNSINVTHSVTNGYRKP